MIAFDKTLYGIRGTHNISTLKLSKGIINPIENIVVNPSDLTDTGFNSDYNFEFDQDTQTYKNTNQEVDDSLCISKVSFTATSSGGSLTINMSQDSEVGCDYGTIVNLDEEPIGLPYVENVLYSMQRNR